jgi:hypothetical protein
MLKIRNSRCSALIPLALAISAGSIQTSHGQSSAGQFLQSLHEDVIWNSTSKNAVGFSNELSELYLTLYNTGRLTVRPDVLAGSASIENVLRQNGILVGPQFPTEIDSLACDLNANRCTRDRAKLVTDDPHMLLANAVLGSAPSRGHWTLSPGDSLVLPAIRLEVVPRWIEIPITRERSLEVIVTKDLGGCAAIDDNCRSDILKHNRSADPNVFRPDFLGTLSLPVIAARARINLSSAKETASNVVHSEPRPDQALVLTASPTEEGSYKVKSVKSSETLDTTTFTTYESTKSAVIQELLPNTVGAPKIKIPFAVQTSALVPDDFSIQQKGLSDLIAFPFKSTADIPLSLQGAVVGVFDSWIDSHHCAFGSRFHIHNVSSGVGPAAPAPGHCDEMTIIGTIDHGTHVAGIIGANLNTGANSSFGLNPFARLETFEVDFSTLSSANQLSTFAANIDTMLPLGVDVVNISFGYMLDPDSGSHDPVQTSIANLRDSVLFVMAAGNYGSDV